MLQAGTIWCRKNSYVSPSTTIKRGLCAGIVKSHFLFVMIVSEYRRLSSEKLWKSDVLDQAKIICCLWLFVV
jgi:hypothetical protein